MLLMDIITWEPKDSLKAAELYMNYEYPKGIKVIEEWADLTGYRTFVIYEADDEKTYAASVLPCIGLCRFETFPVMKLGEFMQQCQKAAVEAAEKKPGATAKLQGAEEEDLLKQIEGLEKRVFRLEHHSFAQQEDTT